MKKITIGLLIAAIVGIILVFYIFRHETVSVGQYTVVYYKNKCDLAPEALPRDLESLKRLPGLIRITWQERIASDLLQEYCYLPGKGVEEGRKIHAK